MPYRMKSQQKNPEVNIMKGHFITNELIEEFKQFLITEEKSPATIEKYIRDVLAFAAYLAQREVTKQLTIDYKQKLISDGYAPRSINSKKRHCTMHRQYLHQKGREPFPAQL